MKTLPLALTISGSPSAYSISHRVLDYIAAGLVAANFRTQAIRARELPASELLAAGIDLPASSFRPHPHPAMAALFYELRRAEVVVIGTPVYHASCTGLLKALLDALPEGALAGKRVLPVATGRNLADVLALDYALRPMFGALGASVVLGGIYAVEGQMRWTREQGLIIEPVLAAQLRRGIAEVAASAPSGFPLSLPSGRLLQVQAAQHLLEAV